MLFRSVKGSKGQRVKKKPIPTPPYERRAEANRVGECLAARRCVIIANLLRCYRIRAWLSPPQAGVALTVCHNSQSASLLSDSVLVMYFSTLPAPSSSAPCILAILTHLRGWSQNVHFDTPYERRADASTPGSASRQGAWLTPRRAKATESPSHRVTESATSVIGF